MDLKPYLTNLQKKFEPYQQQLLVRWHAFSTREKYMVASLAVFLILLIFYQFFYSPLNNGIEHYKEELVNDQETLVFMQAAAPRIQMAKGEVKPLETLSQDTLLPIIEESLVKAELKNSVSELGLNESGQVNIQFKEVDFDKLISWLVELRIQYGIQVVQLTAIPAELPGISNVSLQLALD